MIRALFHSCYAAVARAHAPPWSGGNFRGALGNVLSGCGRLTLKLLTDDRHFIRKNETLHYSFNDLKYTLRNVRSVLSASSGRRLSCYARCYSPGSCVAFCSRRLICDGHLATSVDVLCPVALEPESKGKVPLCSGPTTRQLERTVIGGLRRSMIGGGRHDASL